VAWIAAGFKNVRKIEPTTHELTRDLLKNLFKVGVIAGIIYLVVLGIDAAKFAAAKFSYSIAGYGKPTISNWILNLPIVVNINNPTPAPINADRVIADLYIQKGGQWVAAARMDQPVTVPPGASQQVINAQGNITNIFGGNILNTFNAFAQAVNNKLPIRTDVTVIYGGIALPTQSYTETLTL